jgi:hypothetical protein
MDNREAGVALAAPVVGYADQVARVEADLGQGGFSPRDSRREGEPRSEHA